MSAPWLLLGAVLGASMIGSLHCVGMCGGFVAAVSGARTGPRRELAPLLAYQGARGVAYLSLGVLAGLLGASLEASAAWLGVQRLAGPLMGLSLIAIAVATLWPSGAGRAGQPGQPGQPSVLTIGARPRAPSLIQRARLRLTQAVRKRGAWAGAAAGLLTALLPCGWLWAYVVVAASTGSVADALLVMAAFWLGSVPALLGVGLLAGELGRRLGRHAPRITATIMLVLGALSLVGKLTPAPAAAPPQAVESSAADVQPAAPTTAPCH